MDLLKEAFIEGYKQRAESSNLIFDNASRMYAISLFDKWRSEQLLLHNVSQQRELLKFFVETQASELFKTETGFKYNKDCIEETIKNFNCG